MASIKYYLFTLRKLRLKLKNVLKMYIEVIVKLLTINKTCKTLKIRWAVIKRTIQADEKQFILKQEMWHVLWKLSYVILILPQLNKDGIYE